MIPVLSTFTKEHLRISEQNSDILQLVESFPAALMEITAISRSVRVLEETALGKVFVCIIPSIICRGVEVFG